MDMTSRPHSLQLPDTLLGLYELPDSISASCDCVRSLRHGDDQLDWIFSLGSWLEDYT